MAIYMNSDGFWVNTEKKEEEPESFYASLSKKSTSPGAQLGNNDIAKLHRAAFYRTGRRCIHQYTKR